jgi:hypothetical protein
MGGTLRISNPATRLPPKVQEQYAASGNCTGCGAPMNFGVCEYCMPQKKKESSTDSSLPIVGALTFAATGDLLDAALASWIMDD